MAEKKVPMALCQSSVLKVYQNVIDDVISGVRDSFLDEGVDEQVLLELKQIWRTKLMASKAVEVNPETVEPRPPQIVSNYPKLSKVAFSKIKKDSASAANQSNNVATLVGTRGGPDIKPSVSTLQTNAAGVRPTTSSYSSMMMSGGAIKKEPRQYQQNNPPPLHSTGTASILHKQQQQQQQQRHHQQLQPLQQQQQHQQTSATIPIVAKLDPNRIVPVNISLPEAPGTLNKETRVLTIHVPAWAVQENRLTKILTRNLISTIITLPNALASSVVQQHVNAMLANDNKQKMLNTSKQLDGTNDTSEEDNSDKSDDIDSDDDDDDDDDPDLIEIDLGVEEDPINSGDDITDDEDDSQFDSDNVIVCQFDKIIRSKNKWKFFLKDGIMNIGGKDYVFQKSNGDAEW